jgi:hypothetical protein
MSETHASQKGYPPQLTRKSRVPVPLGPGLAAFRSRCVTLG